MKRPAPNLMRLHLLTLLLACLTAATMLFISEASAWRAQRNLLQIAEIAQARSSIQKLDVSLRLLGSGPDVTVTPTAGETPEAPAATREAALARTQARQDIDDALAALQGHTVQYAAGAALFAQLRVQVERRLDELARRAATASGAPGRPPPAPEREPMAGVRAASTALLAHEWGRLLAAQSAITEVLLAGRWGIATLSALSLLGLVFYLRQAAALQRQQQVLQQLARANQHRLEEEVAHRTRELTELNLHLLSAREDERARLARDLHDELGAVLTAAKLDAARIRARLGDSASEARERLAQLVLTLNRGIALKRRIIEDLHPSALANLGLVATLEILAREFAERAGLAVECSFAPVALDADAELVIYRLVQEATTNIAKHAHARHVRLSLRPVAGGEHGQAWLQVSDDGVGFHMSTAPRSAHGLSGMRFRVQAEGGTMQLKSQPGAGTVIDVWLPASAVGRATDEGTVEPALAGEAWPAAEDAASAVH